MPTIAEIKAQIAELQKQADDMISNEKKNVIKEIRKKMEDYKITVDDLQSKATSSKPPKEKKTPVIKYRKENFTWVGRGPKPQWIKTIESKGESIEKYRVSDFVLTPK